MPRCRFVWFSCLFWLLAWYFCIFCYCSCCFYSGSIYPACSSLRFMNFALMSIPIIRNFLAIIASTIPSTLFSLAGIPIMHMLHLWKLSYGSWMLLIIFPISVHEVSIDLTSKSLILFSTMPNLLRYPLKSIPFISFFLFLLFPFESISNPEYYQSFF